MFLKGFRFGMLLQIAIGPVCVYIFSAAATNGFWVAESGVAAAVLADWIYIMIAILGIGGLLQKKPGIQRGMSVAGGIIIFLFGLNMILPLWGLDVSAGHLFHTQSHQNRVFIQTFLLTVSNPLGILFWVGVFSGKIAEECWERRTLFIYGAGAVASTLFALTITAGFGTTVKNFLSVQILLYLNVCVGLCLCGFACKKFIQACTSFIK